MRFSRGSPPSTKDFREGVIGIDGGWKTPDMMHERSAAIMREFDAMPKKTRDEINDGIPQRRTPEYERYIRAHLK